MVSVISHSHHQFNASVDAFTVHGIIYRHIQTVLVRHVVLDYSAPCQTIVNQVMGPFANNTHISFPWAHSVWLCVLLLAMELGTAQYDTGL